MRKRLTTIDIHKLQERLGRVQIACSAAIELGDCQAVARLTCEAARLREFIDLAGSVCLETA